MKKYFEYIENIEKIIEREKTEGAENAEKASQLLFETIKNGKNIFLFGTGHSHMLAEELFYRAGGLVNIRPILEKGRLCNYYFKFGQKCRSRGRGASFKELRRKRHCAYKYGAYFKSYVAPQIRKAAF